MQENWLSQVRPDRRLTLFTNTLMLLVHIGFAFVYSRAGARLLFAYNLFSIAVFTGNYFLAWTGRERLYYVFTFGEILLFTTLNLLLLGWDYGFELYCFSYAISVQLVAFFLARESGSSRFNGLIGALSGAYFLGMRLLTWRVRPLYALGGDGVKLAMYLGNGLLSLVLCVNYVGLFTRIIRLLASDLSYSSTHDALTDLFNRRRMWEVMRAAEIDGRVDAAVAMLDIDDFKQINDTYGHAAGDAVLRAMAGGLKGMEADGAVVSRWGGEDFVVFFGADAAIRPRVEQALEAFVREIGSRPVAFEGREISFTVTAGLMLSDGFHSVQDLVSAADGLLYEGKNSGKNRLVVGRMEE